MVVDQYHLDYKNRVNLGSYYTKKHLVDLLYSMVNKNINNLKKYTIIDTSCGYGSFFQQKNLPKKKIGADIDETAIIEATEFNPNVTFICRNSLFDVSRKNFHLLPEEKIIIVGNPPYNDTTSIIRNVLKKNLDEIDPELKTRDTGISFLLSYNKLQADYVCVLHPLSYLIKKANFSLLGQFTKNYRLIDSVIISSQEFTETSQTTAFPIIIALYHRNPMGMNYDFILNYPFKTKEGKTLKLSSFNSISNYLSKYPNYKDVNHNNVVAKFWTMRDINALKRSKTFIKETTANTVFITEQQFDYYCYVDVFKQYIQHIPYYLGNCDVMINNEEFLKIHDNFKYLSLKKHPHLAKKIKTIQKPTINISKIDTYFRNLLGNHYVY